MNSYSKRPIKFSALAAVFALAAVAAGQQPADPFATVTDPFGGAPDPFAAAPDPFAQPGAAPFTPAVPPTPADPFGAAGPAAPVPFAAPAAPDPFGAAPADPFGASPAPAADPFGGTTAAPDPFGAGPLEDPFGAGPAADPFGGTGLAGAVLPSEQINPNGISQLYDFRYESVLTWDGRQVVARRKLTREDAVAFDKAKTDEFREKAVNGQLPGFNPAADPGAWAEWSYFAEQLRLWSDYVDGIILAGSDTSGKTAWDMVQWPGKPPEPEVTQTTRTGGGGLDEFGGGSSRQPDVFNENRSLDNQVNDFNPFAEFGGGGGAGGVLPPDAMINQVITAYQDKLTQLRDLESNQQQVMAELEQRIGERQARRLAYNDWREDRQKQIEDFVMDWNRRYNGEVAMIGGIRYELYRPGSVPQNVHRDATVIITDYRLTPYDILNPEDGTLRTQMRR